jgi:hypothetical protein
MVATGLSTSVEDPNPKRNAQYLNSKSVTVN